jgi:hypothetical protein
MKISEIKSDEVRNEAVRLYMKERGIINREKEALNTHLRAAFLWEKTPQGDAFWRHLYYKSTYITTPNTPDLKLPEKNPRE